MPRPETDRYEAYGTKGIRVCDRSRDFRNLLADMGLRPEGKTLGRILDRGNYEPGNVFWMTPAEKNLARKNNHALPKWELLGAAALRKPPTGVGIPMAEKSASCRNRTPSKSQATFGR